MSFQLAVPNRVCPNDEILIALSRGEISEPALSHYLAHLESCLACCRRGFDLERANTGPLPAMLRQIPKEQPLQLPEAPWKGDFLKQQHNLEVNSWDHPEKGLSQFGPFQLEGVLGEGRSGVVYRAFDPVIRRHVALKVLKAEISQRPGMAETFLEEARALARVRDPHVVTLHSFGAEPLLHITMELLEGPTLSEILERGPVPLEKSIRIIRDIALGLDSLHSVQLVHRDIKPSNIRIETGKQGDRAVLLDLGLSAEGNRRAGTPGYMAPEVLRHGQPTPASDIYSLGILFRILLTHAPADDTPLRSQTKGLAFPSRSHPPRKTVPEPIAILINRMLDYHPSHRPSAMEVVAALDRANQPGYPRVMAWGVALTGTAILFSLVGFALSRIPWEAPQPLQDRRLVETTEAKINAIPSDWSLGPIRLGDTTDLFQLDPSGRVARSLPSGVMVSRFEGVSGDVVISTPSPVTRMAFRFPFVSVVGNDGFQRFFDISQVPPHECFGALIKQTHPFAFAWNEDEPYRFCLGLEHCQVGIIEVTDKTFVTLQPAQNLLAPAAMQSPLRAYWQPGKNRILITLPDSGIALFDLFQKGEGPVPRFAFRCFRFDGAVNVSWHPDGTRCLATNQHGELALILDELTQTGNLFPSAKAGFYKKVPGKIRQAIWINEKEIALLDLSTEPKPLPVFDLSKPDLDFNQPDALLEVGASPIVQIASVPKKGWVATLAKDGSVRIWNRQKN